MLLLPFLWVLLPAVSTPALILRFSWKSDKIREFAYIFQKRLSEKRSSSCTLLLQAGGLMSRLHANSSSCLDFFHNAETHCTTEETRRLCCLINNIMLIISNGWEKTNYSGALNICIESRISNSLRKWMLVWRPVWREVFQCSKWRKDILIWARKDFLVLFEIMSVIAPNLFAVPIRKLKGVFKPAWEDSLSANGQICFHCKYSFCLCG